MAATFTLAEVRDVVAQIERINDQIGALEDERDRLARPLEDVAQRIGDARRVMTRTGQQMRYAETGDGSIWFSYTNGRDYGDDGTLRLTFAELAQDPAEVAKAEERKRRDRERADAKAALAAAQRRLDRIDA